MANTSVTEAVRRGRLRRAVREETQRTILREAAERYENELMEDEERMLLEDRIRRARRVLGL